MIRLYTLTSDLHSEMMADAAAEPFVQGIETALGERFCFRGADFSDYGSVGAVDLIYVRTGGTEGLFKQVFCKNGDTPRIPGGSPIRLLTSGESNSLAASMEILSYLRLHGLAGEILHGSAAEIATRLKGDSPCPSATFHRPLGHSRLLYGQRYGIVGHPSDWLISSDVDPRKAADVLGAELVKIDIEELLTLWKDSAFAARESRSAEHRTPFGESSASPGFHCAAAAESYGLKPLNVPKFGRPISDAEFEKALRVYESLRKIVDKYHLNGLTLRCFDLLTAIGTTGCLGLALLNSNGVVATCEGDIPAMLSMAVAQKVAGTPGFQVNLSKITGDDLLFAHCTVPLNIVEDYCYDTHFESGIGVAIHGEFCTGPFTLFKIGAQLEEFVAEDVQLTANQYENRLCRTQVHIQAPGLPAYLLTAPLGNHHILLPGHHAQALNAVL